MEHPQAEDIFKIDHVLLLPRMFSCINIQTHPPVIKFNIFVNLSLSAVGVQSYNARLKNAYHLTQMIIANNFLYHGSLLYFSLNSCFSRFNISSSKIVLSA